MCGPTRVNGGSLRVSTGHTGGNDSGKWEGRERAGWCRQSRQNQSVWPRSRKRLRRRSARSRGTVRWDQLLHQHGGFAAALVVLLAAGRREVLGRAELEPALVDEEVNRLRREGEECREPLRPGEALGVLDELPADALVLVAVIDEHR